MKIDTIEGVSKIHIIKVNNDDKGISLEDYVIIEAPLEIRIKVNNRVQQIAVTMRTPGNDVYLALGFLFTEGILLAIDDVIDVAIIDDNVVQVELQRSYIHTIDNKSSRNTFMSSSCGICGKASLDLIKTNTQYLPWSSKATVDNKVLLSLKSMLDSQDSYFNVTGGNHSVAMYSTEGDFVFFQEDVGRHNAMDKVVGYSLQSDLLPLGGYVILLSGRASFELIQKAMMAGVSIVVSVGAPSSLAIDLALECGITLIGFLKDDRYNIYAGENRITFQPNA